MMILISYGCYLRKGEGALAVVQPPFFFLTGKAHTHVSKGFPIGLWLLSRGTRTFLREGERQMLGHDDLIEEEPGQLGQAHTGILNSLYICFLRLRELATDRWAISKQVVPGIGSRHLLCLVLKARRFYARRTGSHDYP